LRRTERPTSSAADAAALLVGEAPVMWSVVLACHDRCGDRFCAGQSCGLFRGPVTVLRTRPGTRRVISGSGYPCGRGRMALLDGRPASNVANNSQALFARAADHVRTASCVELPRRICPSNWCLHVALIAAKRRRDRTGSRSEAFVPGVRSTCSLAHGERHGRGDTAR